MVGDIVRIAVDHGMWGLAVLIILVISRSRPARELSGVITKEIRWRYLRGKGFSEKELRERLFDKWDDDGPKPPPPVTSC